MPTALGAKPLLDDENTKHSVRSLEARVSVPSAASPALGSERQGTNPWGDTTHFDNESRAAGH